MSLNKLIGSFVLLALIAFHLAGALTGTAAGLDYLWSPAEFLADIRYPTMTTPGGLAAMLALMLGAGVGAGLKPRGALVAGAAVLLLAAMVRVVGAWLGVVLLAHTLQSLLFALGSCVAVPALLAAAATDLYGRREGLRNARMALVVASMGTGTLVGIVVGSPLNHQFGPQISSLFALGGLLIALVLAIGLAVLGRGSETDHELPPAAPLRIVLSAVMAIALAVPLALLTLAMRGPFMYWGYGMVGTLEILAHEVITILAGLIAFGLGLLLFRYKPGFPGLLLAGVGLFLCGIGVGVEALFPEALWMMKRWVFLAMLLLISGGVATALAFGLSRLLGDISPRLTPALAALFLLVMGLTEGVLGWLQWGVGLHWIETVVRVTGILALLLVGLALAIAAIPLQKRVFTIPQSD